MKAVKLYFQLPEGKRYCMSFEIDEGLDETRCILELTMKMLEKQHGKMDFFYEIHDLKNKEEEIISQANLLTVEDLLERLDKEYEEYENEWLQMTPMTLINCAGDIAAIKTGKEYIGFMAEDHKLNLSSFERAENVLSEFLSFQYGSDDGAINEETIEEFQDYLLEEI